MSKMAWLVRSNEISHPNFGVYPGARPIEEHIKNGLVIVDKPAGPSSHQVTAWVRDVFGVARAGHSGTLDPQVTGVLVTTLGNATKIMPALMGSRKEYVAVMHLHKDVSAEEIRRVVAAFIGRIKQKPPRKAAVKRVMRERTIFELEILEIRGRDVLFRTNTEAGTYIRKLIDDMGKKLGGAHMAELRRTRAGNFDERAARRLHDFKDAHDTWKENGDEDQLRELVMPVERGVEHLKKIIVKDTAVDALCNGAPLASGGVTRVEDEIVQGTQIALFTGKGELIALATAASSSEEILKTRCTAAKVERVIMERGRYPATWKNVLK